MKHYYVLVDGPLIDSRHGNQLDALMRADEAKRSDGYRKVKIVTKPENYGLDPKDPECWVNSNPAVDRDDLIVQRIMGFLDLIRESAPFWGVLERMDMKPLTEDDAVDEALISAGNTGISLGFHERSTAAKWMREGDPKHFEVKVIQGDNAVYYGDNISKAAHVFVSLVGRIEALDAIREAEQGYEHINFSDGEEDEDEDIYA